MTQPPFAPGDRVRLSDTGEVGVVVWIWYDDVIGYDAHVAFFGTEYPRGIPAEKPYILRYAATSLEHLDGPSPGER